jgi:hypothetical protein
VGQHHQLGNLENKVQKCCLKSKKEFQIRTEELRRRLLKGGNFQTHKQIFMLIQKILLEVKERIPDTDWRTEKKKITEGWKFSDP